MVLVKKLCLVFFVMFLTACASGSHILTGTPRTPIESTQVQLYLDPPVKYETIGIVKASSSAGWSEQGSQDYAISELKKQAAKLGANGVLLTTTGEKNSVYWGQNANGSLYMIPMSAQTVSGKAIYVEK